MLNKSPELSVRLFNPTLSIQKPDPTFAIWNDLPWEKRIVEVGCGSGLHPISKAKQESTTGVLALERTKNKFSAFSSRVHTHGLPNLYPVNDDALYWAPANLNAVSVDEYYFLYPNPYPKQKQSNKRWHLNPLFGFLLSTLKPGGLVHFASNEQWYIDECREYCLRWWKLKLTDETLVQKLIEFKPRTHFEKKYLARGETCTHLTFQKFLQ